MACVSDPIIVIEDDPRWQAQFELLRDRAMEAHGDVVVSIEQVGSTAVPGCGEAGG